MAESSIRILYEASPLGLGDLFPAARAGIHRVIVELLSRAMRSRDCVVGVTAFGGVYERYGLLEELRHVGLDSKCHAPAYPDIGWLTDLTVAIRRTHRHHFTAGRLHPVRLGASMWRRAVAGMVAGCRPRGQWDLIHCLHSTASVPRGLAGLPRIVTIHDLIPLRLPEVCDPRYVAQRRLEIGRLDPDRDWAVCISECTRRDLVDLTGFPAGRTRVIPNGVSAHMRPAEEGKIGDLRRRYSLGDHPYLLSLGTLEPRKNLKRVVETFSALAERHPELYLVVVGGAGWLDAGFSPPPSLRGRIRVTGRVEDADVPALYSGAIAFCFPSLYEGFGLPPLEAMACGTPVVCSDRGALAEIVGDAGILLDPDDGPAWVAAVEDLIRDPGIRPKLAYAGQRRAASFDWDTSFAAYRTLYGEVLAAGADGCSSSRRVPS